MLLSASYLCQGVHVAGSHCETNVFSAWAGLTGAYFNCAPVPASRAQSKSGEKAGPGTQWAERETGGGESQMQLWVAMYSQQPCNRPGQHIQDLSQNMYMMTQHDL